MIPTPHLQNHIPIVDQALNGYRFSMEPFFLAKFPNLRPGMRILDVGTGSGIIPILLLTREVDLDIRAIEIQSSLLQVAKKNLTHNGMDSLVELVHGNFSQTADDWEHCSFDVIISNPPYGKINHGRINPDPAKAMARHELTLNHQSLIKACAPLLKPEGQLILTYPPGRYHEILHALEVNGLRLSHVQWIYGSLSKEASFFLVSAKKCNVHSKVEDEQFYIYNENGFYSDEMKQVYATFNCTGGSHGDRQE